MATGAPTGDAGVSGAGEWLSAVPATGHSNGTRSGGAAVPVARGGVAAAAIDGRRQSGLQGVACGDDDSASEVVNGPAGAALLGDSC